MGRVLLNLINNAFYAVNERKKTANEIINQLFLSTKKKKNDKSRNKSRDNVGGIPQKL